MKPLAMAGKATELRWDLTGVTHAVVRLRDCAVRCTDPRDALLIDPGTADGGVGLAVVRGGAESSAPRMLRLGDEFAHLADGDVLAIHAETARIRVLYRRNSTHNSFLTTERCNHYCLMCSQPPKNVDDRWLLDEIAAAIPLVDPETRSLAFTGGEPLLEWRRMLEILALARDELPDTAIHLLSNGRAFAAPDIADAWAAIRHPNLCVGIPIYAAVDHLHDQVVQAAGAFDETVMGVLRLKDRGQRVEIRVVLHRLTAPRVAETARWLARNLPFVDHVALMGLENTGFAIANHDRLWIDPVDYQAELAEAVDILDAARVRTSVYNLPYCVLDRSVWPFAVQSISDWKNAYLPQCSGCAAKDRCAGFFSTGRPKTSRAIEPLTALALA